MSDESAWDERNFYCEFCHAEPGERCVTRDGRYAASPHVSRVQAANRVWLREHEREDTEDQR